MVGDNKAEMQMVVWLDEAWAAQVEWLGLIGNDGLQDHLALLDALARLRGSCEDGWTAVPNAALEAIACQARVAVIEAAHRLRVRAEEGA